MKKISFYTNVYTKYKRQDLAIEKLSQLVDSNPNITASLIQFEDETIEYNYSNINILNVLKRSSKNTIGGSKSMPYIKDLFDEASKDTEEVFVFFNSDIILTQKLINHIQNNPVEAYGISRSEILEIENLSDPAHLVRTEPAGFDCWVVSKSWWEKHREKFPDMILGRPFFDVIYTILMLLNSNNHYISNKHLIYHILHGKESFTRDECYFHNEQVRNTEFRTMWDECWGPICNNTFFKREDYGSFLQFQPNENEVIEHYKQNFLQK
jgi:hypothetical protein